jgi:DNA cross-link repair 1A protein
MNSSAACHQVEGLPGLYIDAFKGSFLRKTLDVNNAFVLTHYHGDHYQSLPRDGKYLGSALIHCTPVTAALLRNVHKVPSKFVVEHAYGIPWTLDVSTTKQQVARITFYDANHCPGAAVVAIQLSNGTVHLHTGDMRYHPRLKSYTVIQEAVRNRKLDLLYLDTTYGHPKHTFAPQEDAVEAIASQIHEVLSAHGQCTEVQAQQSRNDPSKPKVLILLSCYSIGKERVLWETSNRVNQPVYVTEKKLAMLSCIHSGKECSSSVDDSQADHPYNQLIQRCTRDPNATDLHVIPMGLAGELWPFFKPNYRKCVDYEEALQHNYDKIIAFIPTGWAEGSNWNKKNAVSNRKLLCRKSERFLDVEIRLIAYSEHSSFSELVSFVEYCRPRKVVPTVFGNDNDRRRLERLFRPYVDSSRAKLEFFKGMQASGHCSAITAANQPHVGGVPGMEGATLPRKPANTKPDEKQIPEDSGEHLVPSASRSNTHGECVDLTGTASGEESESPGFCSKVILTPSKTDSTTTSGPTKDGLHLLAETRTYQPSTKVTPSTKRKRGKSETEAMPFTLPITRFFAKGTR